MRSAVGVLVFLSYFLTDTNSIGIYCFKCTSVASSENKEPERLCSKFDRSERYQVYCPNSTMCMHKTSYVPLGNTTVKSVRSDCAVQVQILYKWIEEKRDWIRGYKVIENVYKTGCSPELETGRPGQPSEYCFCDHDLCNESHSLRPGHPIGVLLLILTALILHQ